MPGRLFPILLVSALLLGRAAVAQPQPPILRAQDFLDGFGVNLHVPYTDGGYVKGDEILRALSYLGIRHVRDHALHSKMPPESKQNYDRLGAAGIGFDMIVTGGSIPGNLDNLRAYAQKHPGALDAIEGPNEVNNWPITHEGKTGTAAAVAFQEALHDAVKADPVLKTLPVYNFTNWPYSAGKADYANIHPYAKKGAQPFAALQSELAAVTALMPGRPVVVTETGYYTLPKPGVGWGGLDEPTQAKMMVNLYLDAALLGIKRTYVYQLLDAYSDPEGKDQEKHFGLFDLAYRPKQAATAIRNLRSFLSDPDPAAASFAPLPLPVSIQGLPATARTLKLQKADGTSVIAIWNEPDIWDESAAKPIAVAPQTVSIDLGTPRDSIAAYAPVSGTAPIAAVSNAARLAVPLADEAVLVVIAPR